MLDINGKEINIGDKVVYTNRNLDDLSIGTIAIITKSKCVVKLRPDQPMSYTRPDGTVRNWVSKSEHNIMYGSQVMILEC